MSMNDIKIFNQTTNKFASNPETFVLFRGENLPNKGGLHFTTDKDWAKDFGKVILKGTLPAGSKIKLLTKDDFIEPLSMGVTSEDVVWFSIFAEGYDAILGHDQRNSKVFDVIVNPKHLGNFKPSNNAKWI